MPSIPNSATSVNVSRSRRGDSDAGADTGAGGFVVWLTGLSGAGKSTLAAALAPRIEAFGRRVEVLDGDEVRTHLSKELGFSREHRDTNVARIAWVAKLLARNGVVVVVSAISPYRAARDAARASIGDFIEVHLAAPLEACARRDAKGYYARARVGAMPGLTGVDDPYEPPANAELVVDTSELDVETCVRRVLETLKNLGYLPEEPLTISTRPAE